MASRMDKYYKEQDNSTNLGSSKRRISKNEQLYEQLYTNKVFTEFTNTNFDNVIDLSEDYSDDNINRREKYQKTKVFNDNNDINKKDYSFNINNTKEYLDKKEKNYNINDILENARKNRNEDDEIEKNRRIKSVEYSILSDLSQEKIKENNENKQKKLTREEEDNLEELIHTITSNSLRKKIDDELLSDLLPSEESETVVSKELFDQLEEIEEKTKEIKTDIEEEKKFDDSFYTKSMELAREDFELEDEDYSFLDERKMGIFPKIMITLLVLGVIGIIFYVVFNFI